MVLSSIDNGILPETNFSGRLEDGRNSVKVDITAWAGDDGRLCLRINNISRDVYLFCAQRTGGVGEECTEFTLSAASDSGNKLISNEISITHHLHSSDGFDVGIEARHISLIETLDEVVAKPYHRFWFRGFKSFRGHEANTPLGRIVICGDAQGVSSDDMSGFVALQYEQNNVPENWDVDGKKLLQHMQMGFEFAHGGRLHVPMIEVCEGDKLKRDFYSGCGAISELAVIHHLNQEAFFEALVNRFLAKGPLSEPFWSAVGWLRTETTYDELRFLTAMTSLETIVSLALPEIDTTVIDKEKFEPIKNDLKDIIDGVCGLENEDRDTLKRNISGANRNSLAKKIESLFDYYGISRQNFEGPVLRDMINCRNDLVHRGKVKDNIELWAFVILARELVSRVVLSEIGFRGRYQCYIDGRESREFP